MFAPQLVPWLPGVSHSVKPRCCLPRTPPWPQGGNTYCKLQYFTSYIWAWTGITGIFIPISNINRLRLVFFIFSSRQQLQHLAEQLRGNNEFDLLTHGLGPGMVEVVVDLLHQCVEAHIKVTLKNQVCKVHR